MKAYKGFKKDLTCRGFQFEEGKTYEEPTASLCNCGFHACEYPLDCLWYYPPSCSVYHVVQLDDVDKERHPDDTKVCAKRVTIGARLTIAGLVQAAINYTFSRSHPEGDKATGYRGAASATGYQGAASATGNRGAASATGDRGAASATGDRGAASATGDQGAASATGDRGAASATGDRGAASATGDQGAASATGYQGAASATGDQGAASATGYRGAASATGDQGAASATGYQGAASATGYRGAASATGDRGAASATGYRGAASATGNRGAASATGKESIACGLGFQCMARGALGCWIVLAERDSRENDYHIKGVKAALIDGAKIKPDTYYKLENGEFVESDNA